MSHIKHFCFLTATVELFLVRNAFFRLHTSGRHRYWIRSPGLAI